MTWKAKVCINYADKGQDMKDILQSADENFESKKWIRCGIYAVKNPEYQPERLSGLESEMTMRQSEQSNERD